MGAAPLPYRRCPASFIGWSCRGILRPRILSCLVSRLLGSTTAPVVRACDGAAAPQSAAPSLTRISRLRMNLERCWFSSPWPADV